MIQKLWSVILLFIGFIGSIFYLKYTGKKEEKLEQSQKNLETGLEIKKDDAIHTSDDSSVVKSRMSKYVRKD